MFKLSVPIQKYLMAKLVAILGLTALLTVLDCIISTGEVTITPSYVWLAFRTLFLLAGIYGLVTIGFDYVFKQNIWAYIICTLFAVALFFIPRMGFNHLEINTLALLFGITLTLTLNFYGLQSLLWVRPIFHVR